MKKHAVVNIILVCIFVVPAFIDIYNGYVQMLQQDRTLLPYIYKGVLCLMSFSYLLLNTKYSKIVRMLLLLSLAAFCYWAIQGYIFDVSYNIKCLFKVLYAYFIMLFLMGNKAYITKEQVINYAILYGVIATVTLFITYFLDIAVYKYGENYGFGIKGLFKAGNDLSLVLLMCNCLACYMFTQTARIYYVLANMLLTSGGIFVGTVAGVFGSIFIIGCLLFSFMFFKDSRKQLKRLQKLYIGVIMVIAIPVLYNAAKYIINYDSYMQNKFAAERLLSGGARTGLREGAIQILKSYDAGEALFGRGEEQVGIDMGRNVMGLANRDTQIEIDHYHLLCPYGILLGGLLFLLPILLAIQIAWRYYKHRQPFDFWSSVALGLFLVHAIEAGHAYTNLVAMQTIAVLYFCYEKKEDAIFKRNQI